MQKLKNLAKRLEKLTAKDFLRYLYNTPEFTGLIIKLNVYDQLYEKGINSLGEKLRSPYARFGGAYSMKTIILKEAKGQPTDRVTLKDTGTFHNSFKLKFDSAEYFLITANPMKKGKDILEVWGREVIGLTGENLDKVVTLGREKIQEYVRKTLLQ